jgi:hypothetical protein
MRAISPLTEAAIMTYGVIIKVAVPIQAYRASHAEVEKVTGGNTADGMLLHVARATDAGFEIIEVWESKEAADKFNGEVVRPAVERTGVDMSGPEPEVIEFQPEGIMLGHAFA